MPASAAGTGVRVRRAEDLEHDGDEGRADRCTSPRSDLATAPAAGPSDGGSFRPHGGQAEDWPEV